jgi:hypothetical protein
MAMNRQSIKMLPCNESLQSVTLINILPESDWPMKTSQQFRSFSPFFDGISEIWHHEEKKRLDFLIKKPDSGIEIATVKARNRNQIK